MSMLHLSGSSPLDFFSTPEIFYLCLPSFFEHFKVHIFIINPNKETKKLLPSIPLNPCHTVKKHGINFPQIWEYVFLMAQVQSHMGETLSPNIMKCSDS